MSERRDHTLEVGFLFVLVYIMVAVLIGTALSAISHERRLVRIEQQLDLPPIEGDR